MCSVESLRHFMSDRLTAAAEEIFTEFKKTIVRYQEEIDRQRRLLDIIWKPHIPLQSIELPQSYVCENEKTVVVHQPHDQEKNSMVDHDDPEPLQIKDEQEELCSSQEKSNPELPQIKSEQEEFCTILNQSNSELPLIKTEQDELCFSQEEEQFGLKQETDNFVVTPAYGESDHSEPKPNSDPLLFHISCAAESPDQEESKDVDSGSTRCVNLMLGHQSTSSHSNGVDNVPMSERQCDNDKSTKPQTCELCGKSFGRKSNLKRHHRIHTGEKPYSCDICGKSFKQLIHVKSHMRSHTELPQSYVCENVKTVVDHQPHDQERNSMVDHNDPEPLPIKVEQEELCSSQEEEQLGLKQETDNFVVTPAYEESDHNEPKPNSDQLLFHISCAAESPDQEGSKDVDSGSTGCVNLKTGHQSTSSLSNDVDNAPISERQCDNDKATKPQTCELCGKSFGRKSNLKRHQRIHTGEKPYSCDICGQSFKQLIHVKTHMRSHTGEKPYSCITCGKRFSRLSTHYRHMAVHKKKSHVLVKHVEKASVSGPI